MRYINGLKQHTYTPNEFYDYLAGVEDAMAGDIAVALPKFKLTVTEAGKEPVLDVTLEVQNTAELPYKWYHGTKEVKLATASTAGTFAVVGEDEAQGTSSKFDLAFENGVATFQVALDGTWAADDTITATFDDDDTKILGVSVEKAEANFLKVEADPVEGD